MAGTGCMGVRIVGVRIMGVRIEAWTAIWVGLAACLAAPASLAADCPGHPDAIGTSRTIVVDPAKLPRIGTMQYPDSLPLRDHEVVLTFDDGPLPPNSNNLLQILEDNCVKATFFLVGEQARAHPQGVRDLVAAGQTIGTHSQTHPLTFHKMSVDKIAQEVDGGIASVTAALPDPSALAPFFRIPGLLRSNTVDNYLASKHLQVWSADLDADDWKRVSPGRVYDLVIKRLEARHKGVVLLHDIHARTVTALPKILHELKARGYHIVQVVPATPYQQPAPSADVPVAGQPELPTFAFDEAKHLVSPTTPPDFSTPDGKALLQAEPFDRVTRPLQGVAKPTQTVTLPAPSESVFEQPEKSIPTTVPAPARTAAPVRRSAARRAPTLRAVEVKPRARARLPLPESRQRVHVEGDRGDPRAARAQMFLLPRF